MKRNLMMVMFVAVCTLMLFAGKANAAQTSHTHVVVKGESLRKIAEAHYGKGKVGRKLMKRIAWVNRIKNPDKIFPGQLIKFPQFLTPKKTAGKKPVKAEKNVQPKAASAKASVASVAALPVENKTEDAGTVKEKAEAVKEQPQVAETEKFEEQEDDVDVILWKSAEIRDQWLNDYVDWNAREIRDLLDASEEMAAAEKRKVAEAMKPPKMMTLFDIPPSATGETVKLSKIEDDRSSNLAADDIKKTQGTILPYDEPVKTKKKQGKDDVVDVDGEIGYFWGCLNLPGKCQWLGADLDYFINNDPTNKFGLNFGTELVYANMQDVDSNLKRMMYSFFAGVTYQYKGEKSAFVMRNGIMYQTTDDDIKGVGNSVGDSFSGALSGAGIDPTSLGIDFASLNVNFKRTQSGFLYYNNMDYSKKFEKWKGHLGTELRIPLYMKFKTSLPANSMGSSEMDQTLAIVSLGVQRKIAERTFLGIEAYPIFYSGEIKMSGAKTALALDYKNLSFEGGVLMYPYGLSKDAKASGGTPSKMTNAFIALKVKF